MKSFSLTLVVLILIFTWARSEGSFITDIASVEGEESNHLSSVALVVGLAGDGDGNLTYKTQALDNLLQRYGINAEQVSSKNIAVVMVTANIRPFLKPGTNIDVTVSSLGDAKSLNGGVLLETPLIGADGVVYATAQGPIAVGGFLEGGGGSGGASVQKNHPTVGKIVNGAIVQREIPTEIIHNQSINLLLQNPDYTTAVRMADAINQKFKATSIALNPATVNVKIPEAFCGQEPNFIAILGAIDVVPNLPARVIINERTGTIVATSNVRISTVAISHGALTVTISNQENVSQPEPFSETGQTVVTNSEQASVTEMQGGFSIVNNFPTIERLTTALNALGVTTREMMSILQSIKSAGALQAELIIN